MVRTKPMPVVVLLLFGGGLAQVFVGVVYHPTWFVIALTAVVVVESLFLGFFIFSQSYSEHQGSPGPMATREYFIAWSFSPYYHATFGSMGILLFGAVALLDAFTDFDLAWLRFLVGIIYLVVFLSAGFLGASFSWWENLVDRVAGEATRFAMFYIANPRASFALYLIGYSALGAIALGFAAFEVPFGSAVSWVALATVFLMASRFIIPDDDAVGPPSLYDTAQDALEEISDEVWSELRLGDEAVDLLLKKVDFIGRRGKNVLVVDLVDLPADAGESRFTWQSGLAPVTAGRALAFRDEYKGTKVSALLVTLGGSADESLQKFAEEEKLAVLDGGSDDPPFGRMSDYVDDFTQEFRTRVALLDDSESSQDGVSS